MFPRLRQQLGSGFLTRLDVLVELSTLGEYGVSEEGRAIVLNELGEVASAPPERLSARTRDGCSRRCSSPGSLAATRRRGAQSTRS